MVISDDVATAATSIGFKVPSGHEEDYAQLLLKTEQACQAVLSMPDYNPEPLIDRFPRSNVHLPSADENPLRAWAWKADIGDTSKGNDGLLSGKTVVFKDTICVAEVPLLFGTDAFEGYIPSIDATVVTRVLVNGGHILGKAACENFSHGASSSSSPQGPVENPYAKGFSAGGSSSGCGSLIGAGVADMGIGGDQGGSIRIPASLCGVVGLKPTFGLVPYTGVLSSETALDHVGPMARTVLDAACLLKAVAGYDSIDDRQLGAPPMNAVPDYPSAVLGGRGERLQGIRIGILKEAFSSEALAPAVKEVVEKAIQEFRDLGAEVEEVSVPMFSVYPHIGHILNKFGSGGTRMGRQVGRRGLYINEYWDQLLPWTQEKYEKAKYFVTGTAMSSEHGFVKYPTAYGRAMNLGRKMKDDFDAVLKQYDVVILPTLPQPARRHIRPDAGPLEWAQHAPGITTFTGPFNVTGHPALSIPVGLVPCMPEDIQSAEDEDIRLPVGMTLVGKLWDEATVLRIGDAWEQSRDWKVGV